MNIKCKHDELVPIADLLKLQHPRNPNRHPDEQLEAYWTALETVGIRRAVTLSKLSGCIVRGHGLLLSLARGKNNLQDGLQFGVPVEYQEYESETEELTDLAADNRIPELSHPDLLTLKNLLDDVQAEEIAGESISFFNATGYDVDDLEELQHEIDRQNGLVDDEGEGEIPPPPEPKPSSGNLLELIAKAAGLDGNEVSTQWEVMNPKGSSTPSTWSINKGKRRITLR